MGPPRVLGLPRVLGPHRFLGPHRVLDPHRVLGPYSAWVFLGSWVLIGSCVLIGSWVLLESWVLIGSWVLIRSWVLGSLRVLGPAFPVCLHEIANSYYKVFWLILIKLIVIKNHYKNFLIISQYSGSIPLKRCYAAFTTFKTPLIVSRHISSESNVYF